MALRVEDISIPERTQISAIDKASVHRICSGQVIADLATAVKELVENSIDAGATAIEVRLKDYGLEAVEVIDNGAGIAPEDHSTLALKHHTSKITSFADIYRVQSFGFRGEALSSLCAFSKVSVVTCTPDTAPVGTHLEFDSRGVLTSSVPAARAQGTTVTLSKLFSSLPVRLHELKRNVKREYAKCVGILQAYALVSTGVRLSMSNQSGKSMKENISNVFGVKVLESLAAVNLVLRTSAPDADAQIEQITADREEEAEESSSQDFCVEVSGYISRPSPQMARNSGDRQFLYVNGRPCDIPRVSKAINEVYASFVTQKYPVTILNLQLGTDRYDVNITPDKRTILLENERRIIEALKEQLFRYFEAMQGSYTTRPLAKPTFPAGSILSMSQSMPVHRLSANDGVADDTESEDAHNDNAEEAQEPVRRISAAEASSRDATPSAQSSLLSHFAHKSGDRIRTAASAPALGSPSLKRTAVGAPAASDARPPRRPPITPAVPRASGTLQPSSSSQARYLAEISADVTLPADTALPTRARLRRRRQALATHKTATPVPIPIGSEDPAAAENELDRLIRKPDFAQMQVLGQFNLGFIVVCLGADLFIVDQHASDEKYNYETLKRTMRLDTQRLLRPFPLQLTAQQELVAAEHADGALRANGFHVAFDPDAPPSARVTLLALPQTRGTSFTVKDLEELLYKLDDVGGGRGGGVSQQPRDVGGNATAAAAAVVRCSRVDAIMASRACRMSVMIGDALDLPQMKKIVLQMGEMDQPWSGGSDPYFVPSKRALASSSFTQPDGVGPVAAQTAEAPPPRLTWLRSASERRSGTTGYGFSDSDAALEQNVTAAIAAVVAAGLLSGGSTALSAAGWSSGLRLATVFVHAASSLAIVAQLVSFAWTPEARDVHFSTPLYVVAFCGAVASVSTSWSADVSAAAYGPLAGLVATSTSAGLAVTAVSLPRLLKRARRALRAQTRELEVMTIAQQQSKTGSWETYTDSDSGVRYICGSEQWHRIYGIDPPPDPSTQQPLAMGRRNSRNRRLRRREPIEWERWNKLIVDRDSARSQAFVTGLSEGRSFETDGVIFAMKRENDGTEIAVRAFVHASGPTMACGATQDVTDQMKEESRLTKMKDDANRTAAQKDIFLATMSHELRTPLTSIIGHIELMKETRLDKSQKEYVDNAYRGATTLLALINNILDYSKLAAGAVELDIHAMQPAELISDVRAIAKDLTPGVSLDIKNYEGPPTLAADSLKLRQVVLNIAANAMKFSPPNGTVTVELTCVPLEGKDAMLKITVQDHGIGMSEETISRLFTPFVQAEASTTRRYGGTGLGLSIVKRLVSAMNGKIAVRSAEKMGTTFEVSLPVRITTMPVKTGSIPSSSFSPASTPPASMFDASSGTGVTGFPAPPTRILLAEDNRITQTLVKRMLRAYQVDAADNGAEALVKLKEAEDGALNPYSILLCDLNMAVMGGLEAVRAIRKREAENDAAAAAAAGDAGSSPRRLYVVGLSASAFENDREDCLAAGMDSFLSKPFTKAGLLAAVRAAVAATNPASIAQAMEAARPLNGGGGGGGGGGDGDGSNWAGTETEDTQASKIPQRSDGDKVQSTSASAAEGPDTVTSTGTTIGTTTTDAAAAHRRMSAASAATVSTTKSDLTSFDEAGGLGSPERRPSTALESPTAKPHQHQRLVDIQESPPSSPSPVPHWAADQAQQQQQEQQRPEDFKALNHHPLTPDAENAELRA
ncbi:Mismatch repair endonuclease pms2 [Geranomyces variabilis]|uniref:DNA mismatch repair protein PMS1 n=1 Tax=Geranomyces variabilis TaxID=109894 RepID=A0AAD5XR71_9FUNG|nr:Mismatch repair endonuclease pms2 [Geranomyces variabilis]